MFAVHPAQHSHTFTQSHHDMSNLGGLKFRVWSPRGLQGAGEYRCQSEDHFTPPHFFLIKISSGWSKSTSKGPHGKHPG